MPIYDDSPQGSEGWLKIRAGVPSASNFSDIITTQGKTSTSRLKYMYTLVGEKLLGMKEDGFQSEAMLRGVEMESEAREVYSFITGNEVETVGFCFADEKKLYGCSSDGLIGEDGMVEIKCRKISNHIECLISKDLKSPEFQQVQGQLLVTGRKWVDYFCYYPGLPHLLIKVFPDKVFIKSLKVELELFCESLEEVIAKIK